MAEATSSTIFPGTKFGRWILVRYDRDDDRGPRWVCRCVCGRERSVSLASLRAGSSKACGCTRGHRTHGQAGVKTTSAEYWVWHSMRQRCENPNDTGYSRYGARGIRVCETWAKFEAFFADMGARPSSGHSIDRIDSDGDYEPTNCRWATIGEQNRNTSRNVYVEHDGRRMVLKDWAREYGVPYMTLKARYRDGMEFGEALRLPSGHKDRKPGSGYRGVYFHPKKARWQVKFDINGRSKSFGYYDTPEQAARVYNVEIRRVYGDGAFQNLIP